jgi:cation:H+ antiporter
VLTRDFPVMLGLALLLFVMAYGWRGPGRINRFEGAFLMTAFCGYQTLLYFSELAT